MLESNYQKIFESLVMPWFYTNPIFFKLFCLQKLVENTELPISLRVGKGLIEYNPNMIKDKSREKVRNELALELKRIILRHPFRRPKNDKTFDKEVWYEASTMTITQKNVNLLGLKKNRDIEYYYEMLRKKKSDEIGEQNHNKKNEKSDNSQSKIEKQFSQEGKNSDEVGGTDNINSCDSNIATIASELWSCDDLQEGKNSGEVGDTDNINNCDSNIATIASELWSCDDQQEENKIDYFMEENSNLAGTLPKDIEKQLSLMAVRKSRIPSCVKLLKYFKALRENNNYILTRMRPNRRFGYAQMGKIRRATPGKILAGLDVSGSISESQIIQFYTALEDVFDRSIKHIEIFQFDMKLKTEKPIPFKKRSQINIRGRGGTSFQPIFDYIIKNQKQYDGLIIFTDGFAQEPQIHSKLYTKVLWVLPNNNCYCSNQKMLSKSGLVTVLV